MDIYHSESSSETVKQCMPKRVGVNKVQTHSVTRSKGGLGLSSNVGGEMLQAKFCICFSPTLHLVSS
jgi:hypothetical protein